MFTERFLTHHGFVSTSLLQSKMAVSVALHIAITNVADISVEEVEMAKNERE